MTNACTSTGLWETPDARVETVLNGIGCTKRLDTFEDGYERTLLVGTGLAEYPDQIVPGGTKPYSNLGGSLLEALA